MDMTGQVPFSRCPESDSDNTRAAFRHRLVSPVTVETSLPYESRQISSRKATIQTSNAILVPQRSEMALSQFKKLNSAAAYTAGTTPQIDPQLITTLEKVLTLYEENARVQIAIKLSANGPHKD